MRRSKPAVLTIKREELGSRPLNLLTNRSETPLATESRLLLPVEVIKVLTLLKNIIEGRSREVRINISPIVPLDLLTGVPMTDGTEMGRKHVREVAVIVCVKSAPLALGGLRRSSF